MGGRGARWRKLKLRDELGNATDKVLTEGFAKLTPLKDGTPFYMWHNQNISELMEEIGEQKLDKDEVLAQELAKEWIRISKLYGEAVYKIEEDLLWMEADDIRKEARKKGLIPRVNEILTERKFKGEKLEE